MEESQAVQQKSIASFFSVQKGTSAHEITPASVPLAKTTASSAAKAKEARAAAKADSKVVTKVDAKKAASKVAVESKAAVLSDAEADKCVKSYFPGTYSLCNPTHIMRMSYRRRKGFLATSITRLPRAAVPAL